MDRDVRKSVHRRRESANFISRLLFWWTVPIIRLANRRELEVSDFDITSRDDSVNNLKKRIARHWKMETDHPNPNLLRAFFKTFWREFLAIFCSAGLLQVVLRLGTPVLLGYLLSALGGESSSATHLNLLTGLYLLSIFASTLLLHQLTVHVQRCGAKARIAFTGLIYEKVLKLSSGVSVGGAGVGNVLNLVSNDLGRFDRGIELITFAIIAPIQALAAIAILWKYVGVSVMTSFVIMVALAIFQGLMGKISGTLRLEMATRTDRRMRLFSELLTGLFLVKAFLWEALYIDAVAKARRKETERVLRKARLQALNFSIFEVSTKFCVMMIFLSYILLGNTLSAESVFVVLSVLNAIGRGMGVELPYGINLLVEVLVSIQRTQVMYWWRYLAWRQVICGGTSFGVMTCFALNFASKVFLLQEEKESISDSSPNKQLPKVSKQNEPQIEVEDLSVRRTFGTDFVLSGLSFVAHSGEFLVITGSVGTGKSTLLLALLSELRVEKGNVKLHGTTAYVPQEAWLLPETVRENILFGLDYDPVWYETVAHACALTLDFESLEMGDLTLVGEKGSNLSGGQKARVNLARACYSQADIYLLDDPLSAIDGNVARHIMEQCIRGLLKNKCVLLTTTQTDLCEGANRMISLGPTIEGRHSNPKLTIDELCDIEELAEKPKEAKENTNYGTFSPRIQELQSVGRISVQVIREYVRAGNLWKSIIFSIALFPAFQLFATGSDYWLKIWIDLETQKSANHSNVSQIVPGSSLNSLDLVGIYALLIFMALILSFLKCHKLMKNLVHSSIALHGKMTRAIVRAPMRFIEINSRGTILNRFALDTGIMDELLPIRITFFLSTVFQMLGSCVLVILVEPMMIIPTAIISLLGFQLIQTYMRAGATIKRLEGIRRSPILTQINSTISGLATIRAFRKEQFLINKFDVCQDTHSSVFFTYLYTSRWLIMTAELLGDIYTLIVILGIIVVPTSLTSFGIIATTLLSAISSINLFTTQVGELSVQLTSAERIIEFSRVKPEGALRIGRGTLPPEWPCTGNLRMDNICVRYGDGPLTLQDINIKIKPQEKIGIIGRTGAGKSTLIAVLLRIVEKTSGYIHIDSIDTSKIGLHDLREKISIIPQSAFLVSGTVRKSVDPLGLYDDAHIWEALKKVQLDARLTGSSPGLDTKVEDGGLNFSQGERQLFCIARTLLMSNKFIVFDEATSSIDPKTDKIIQEVIRSQYKKCTVLTIAHRLESVMESDRILVLDAGRVVEFDHPIKLLENTRSYLYRLVQRTGPSNAQILYNIATRNFAFDSN